MWWKLCQILGVRRRQATKKNVCTVLTPKPPRKRGPYKKSAKQREKEAAKSAKNEEREMRKKREIDEAWREFGKLHDDAAAA